MRAYFWTNFMLSSIQHGIQTQHCTAEMFTKYQGFNHKAQRNREVLFDWATNHKTTIIKNGGTYPELIDIYRLFETQEVMPWADFREDESLNFMMTCVGIIVPEKIYNFQSFNFTKATGNELAGFNKDTLKHLELTEFEYKLFQLINSTSLAR